MKKLKTVPLDMSWFLENFDEYLKRKEFVDFQNIIGFDYRDCFDETKIEHIAKKICHHSSLFYEIRRNKGGAFFPEKVYREDSNYFNSAPEQIPEADNIFMYRPMCYSLKLRANTINKVILPYLFDTKLNKLDNIIVANLGSGLGKDIEYTAIDCNYLKKISRIINIDLDLNAINIGKNLIPNVIKDKVSFYNMNFIKNNPENVLYNLALLIGIICPLTDESAINLLKNVYNHISYNGFILVSSSSAKMSKHDPFCSFNIQLCAKWALNCRSEECLKTVLEKSGFCDIEILSEPSGYNLVGVGRKK